MRLGKGGMVADFGTPVPLTVPSNAPGLRDVLTTPQKNPESPPKKALRDVLTTAPPKSPPPPKNKPFQPWGGTLSRGRVLSPQAVISPKWISSAPGLNKPQRTISWIMKKWSLTGQEAPRKRAPTLRLSGWGANAASKDS